MKDRSKLDTQELARLISENVSLRSALSELLDVMASHETTCASTEFRWIKNVGWAACDCDCGLSEARRKAEKLLNHP